MSARRFAAYFFAIAAGSTFAFASTLRGQPAPEGEAAMSAGLVEAGMTPTATDAGLDALSPETTRLFRQGWARRHRAPAAGGAQAK